MEDHDFACLLPPDRGWGAEGESCSIRYHIFMGIFHIALLRGCPFLVTTGNVAHKAHTQSTKVSSPLLPGLEVIILANQCLDSFIKVTLFLLLQGWSLPMLKMSMKDRGSTLLLTNQLQEGENAEMGLLAGAIEIVVPTFDSVSCPWHAAQNPVKAIPGVNWEYDRPEQTPMLASTDIVVIKVFHCWVKTAVNFLNNVIKCILNIISWHKGKGNQSMEVLVHGVVLLGTEGPLQPCLLCLHIMCSPHDLPKVEEAANTV